MKEVEQVLTTNEIANVLGVNRHKASDLMASGKIRAFKIGNRWRATKSALESYMRGQEPQETELRELDSKLTEPCPFCGCNDLDGEYDGEYLVAIHCTECGTSKSADVFDEYSAEVNNKLAIEAWNRRYVDIERMEEVIRLFSED